MRNKLCLSATLLTGTILSRIALAQPSIPEPDITTMEDFYNLINGAAVWVMVFGIILGVLFVIWGGIQIVVSRGNDQQLTEGKKTITWAIVGIIVLILAYSIVNIIARFLGSDSDVVAPLAS